MSILERMQTFFEIAGGKGLGVDDDGAAGHQVGRASPAHVAVHDADLAILGASAEAVEAVVASNLATTDRLERLLERVTLGLGQPGQRGDAPDRRVASRQVGERLGLRLDGEDLVPDSPEDVGALVVTHRRTSAARTFECAI